MKEERINQDDLEDIVQSLYKRVDQEKKGKTQTCKIILGSADYPEILDKVEVLDFLKQKGIILDYSTKEGVSVYNPSREKDYSREDFSPEDLEIEQSDVLEATCKLDLVKFINYQKKLDKDKKEREKPKPVLVKLTDADKIQIASLVNSKNKKKEHKQTTLYLDINGNFWREPKIKNCYKMKEYRGRHRFILFLAKNRGYQPLYQILKATEGKNLKSLQKEKRKINENIKKFINLKNDVIDSKVGSGYRIDPKYKIILKNTKNP